MLPWLLPVSSSDVCVAYVSKSTDVCGEKLYASFTNCESLSKSDVAG
jgi:hypothetical protein